MSSSSCIPDNGTANYDKRPELDLLMNQCYTELDRFRELLESAEKFADESRERLNMMFFDSLEREKLANAKLNLLLDHCNAELDRLEVKYFKFKTDTKSEDKIFSRKMKVSSMNARGVHNKVKSIENILEKQDLDICAISEIGTKSMPKIKGYKHFTKYDNRKMHGITILVKNELIGNILRIHDESDLECVHIRMGNCVPAMNIIAVYLDVESRSTVDEVDKIFQLYTSKVNEILEKGESVICIGDHNKPLQNEKDSHGTKLLKQWLSDETMNLLNDPSISTRIDPASGKGSTLDLAMVSSNIAQNVRSFEVDVDKVMTPFSMTKRDNSINQKFTDHRTITLTLETIIREKKTQKRKLEINKYNTEGWKIYPQISDQYAEDILDAVRSIDDPDQLETRLTSIDTQIQIDAFGLTWTGTKKKGKKRKNKDSRSLNEMFNEQISDIDNAITNCMDRKDVNSKMHKLRTLIMGPKIKPVEPAAINDPVTKCLITDQEEIKEAALNHNLNILRKQSPEPEHEEIINRKLSDHNKIMDNQESQDNEWVLDKALFDKVSKRISEKNKRMFDFFTKAGQMYKDAIFELMKKLIHQEMIPETYDHTSLTPIWKKKGSALDLNNMRFIHMKHWRPKLLEGLITEKMKANIVSATPAIQIGGMPGSQSVQHLIVLKSWIKLKDKKKEPAVFCLYDLSKFFDRESLLDVCYNLHHKANIDDKSYRMWFKLNNTTKISVKTSVGESNKAPVPDTVAQGSFGAALASSMNLGCSIDDTFGEENTASFGNVDLNCLILQDDISKMNDSLKQAREGCSKIDKTLQEKLLKVNYDKSCVMIIGKDKCRKKLEKEVEENPIKMGQATIQISAQEKYLGDYIDNRGNSMSIEVTIKDRIRKLHSVVEEIIEVSNHRMMRGLRNSNLAFKQYEAKIIPALLNNCESWIDISKNHIKLLQGFQDKFIRKVLHLPHTTPKAMLNWDVGLWPMAERIKLRKLVCVSKILQKPDSNIAKQVLKQENEAGIEGLMHECREICSEINLPSVEECNLTKGQIKSSLEELIKNNAKKEVENCKKISDRMSENPQDNSYLDRMGLTYSRVWIRHRCRMIKDVKMNFKRSWKNNLTCRFCNQEDESQEHLETVCTEVSHERRGLDLEKVTGKVSFWLRMERKFAATVALAARHLDTDSGD